MSAYVSPVIIHCHLTEVYGGGGGVIRVQHVTKSCRQFESGLMDLNDIDCTS